MRWMIEGHDPGSTRAGGYYSHTDVAGEPHWTESRYRAASFEAEIADMVLGQLIRRSPAWLLSKVRA